MTSINYFQQVGGMHCLYCHKVITSDFPEHVRRKHLHSRQNKTTPCTEKCGKYFTPKVKENELMKIITERDTLMRKYWISVKDGFEHGYPIEWDSKIMDFLSSHTLKVREEVEERIRIDVLEIVANIGEPNPSSVSMAMSKILGVIK